MNLDLLISKYLDGELTFEEDIELRDRLKDNLDEREEFNSAIILTDAIKKDAESIVLPEALAKATEDRILMKILANTPIVEEKPLRKVYKRIAFAMAIIAFLFLNIFTIEDLFKDNNIPDVNIALNKIRDELIAQQNDIRPQISITFPNTKRNNKSIVYNHTNSISNENGGNYNTNSLILSNSNNNSNLSPEADKSYPENNTMTKNSNKISDNEQYKTENLSQPLYFFSDNNINKFQKDIQLNQFFNNSIFNLNNANKENSFNLYGKVESGKIELSSFFGTDLSRSGFNAEKNTTITHFSQSIAYSLDNTNKLGIEFGYTQYSYTGNIMVNVPINGQPNNVNENPNIGHGQDEFISVPFPVNQKKQILWASTFYENTFFDYSDFSLNGRIAIGGSNDGPLTYGRFFTKYEFIKGISATLGTEGRLFFAKLPDINNSEKTMKATFSLIYGFQIIF